MNQKEEESSVLYAKNFYVCVSWEKGGVVVNEVFERTCHFSFLCGLSSPKDTTAEQLCRMHIVPGLHMIEDMIKAKTMWTLSGHQLTFTSQVRNLLKTWAWFHIGTGWSLSIVSLMGFLLQKTFFCDQNKLLLCAA